MTQVKSLKQEVEIMKNKLTEMRFKSALGIARNLITSRLSLVLLTGVVAAAASTIRADVVTDWNQITLNTQAAVPFGIRTPPATRALAMVHAAVYDSINAIYRTYAVYAVVAQPPAGTSPDAAAAAAAHSVLLALYPSQQANLDAAYVASLFPIPDGQSKTDGINLGNLVGAATLALRSNDGSASNPPYTQPAAPGVFQPAVPGTALFVGWGQVTPFALKSGSQFRGEGPPALTSLEYATDFNEVKSVGAINSATRTPYQTETALFWAENSLTTSTAPGGVVHYYTSFSQAARENMESRVWIGYHFRTACRHGFNQGRQVGSYVFHH